MRIAAIVGHNGTGLRDPLSDQIPPHDAKKTAISVLHAAAVRYAEAGLKVFPLVPRAKTPLTAHGFKDATCDLDQIDRWWTVSPNANIGLPCAANGLVVVDVDPRNGGDQTWKDLIGNRTFAVSWTQSSRGDGAVSHYCFAAQPGASYPGSLGPGVDIKNDGYILAEPSIHPETGKPYRWLVSPSDVDLAEAPRWLFAKDDAPRAVATAEKVGNGERNKWLTAFAGRMRRFGATEAEILAAIRAANATRCEPPLAADEVETIARSVARYDAATQAAPKEKIGPLMAVAAALADEEWRDVFRRDRFTGQVAVCRQPPGAPETDSTFPRQITDTDAHLLRQWLEQHTHMVGKSDAIAGIDIAAGHENFHPIQAWLDSLPAWDGVARLNTALADLMGASASDYTAAAFRRWMISAIARVYQPGCKADLVLCLVGAQGTFKSSFVAALSHDPRWFSDCLEQFEGKDAAMHLRGRWIVELAELGPLAKATPDTAKAYLSRQADKYRPPYGAFDIEIPRQNVFIVTTNKATFLVDETGNRRFLPVRVENLRVPHAALEEIVPLLWAEALAAYRAGEPWHLDPAETELALSAQEACFHADAWQDAIAAAVDAMPQGRGITLVEVALAIGLSLDRIDSSQDKRLRACLRRHGYEVTRIRAPKDTHYVIGYSSDGFRYAAAGERIWLWRPTVLSTCPPDDPARWTERWTEKGAQTSDLNPLSTLSTAFNEKDKENAAAGPPPADPAKTVLELTIADEVDRVDSTPPSAAASENCCPLVGWTDGGSPNPQGTPEASPCVS